MLKYLIKHGYGDITVCDQKVDLKEKMPEGVSVRLGEHYLNGLGEFDVIFRSPGVNYYNPSIVEARLEGKEITSPTQYFLDECPCTIVGITGTKGKGTTATLIYEILKEFFKSEGKFESEMSGNKEEEFKKSFKKAKKRNVYLGGNIGNAPIEFLDKLKGGNIKSGDVVVLELSCFQLGDLTKSPHIAVILNTTSDHLDYYPDMDEYMRAKELILAHQDNDDLAILNKDYEYSQYYSPQVKGRLLWISPHGEKLEDGVYIEGLSNVWDGGVKVNSAKAKNDPAIIYAKKGKTEKIMKVKDVALIGSHNLENVCPSVAVAKEFGVPAKIIENVVKKFKGLPNRLEFVRKIDGVFYYNDSFSTNPQTSMAAVDSFDVPTILIAGGSDKGLGYYEWARKILIKPSLRVVLLIGETAEKMWDAINTAEKKLKPGEGSPTMVAMCKNLKEALNEAKKLSAKIKKTIKGRKKEAVVVMSSAAASFDQFKDYKDRGYKFKEIVKGM